MAADQRKRHGLVGVARHTETEGLYSLTADSGVLLATFGADSNETWLADPAVLADRGDPVAGRWRHFKGGLYDFVCRAQETTTGESLVVYTSADGRVWLRPERMVSELVKRDGRETPRFRRAEFS